MVNLHCHHAGNYVNVALNRSAFQVSTYRVNYASLAVSSNPNGYSCTASATKLANIQHWWTVDLGGPNNVIAVNVTNDVNTNFREQLIACSLKIPLVTLK